MIKIMMLRGGGLAITNRLRFKFRISFMPIKNFTIVFGLSRGSADWSSSFSVETVYNLSAETSLWG